MHSHHLPDPQGNLAQPPVDIDRLLDIAHDAIFVRTLDGSTIVYWNRGAEELYGWSASEAIGQTSHALLRTVFPQPLDQIEWQLLDAGNWEGELIHKHRAGTTIIVTSYWVLQRDADGHPLAHLEISRDITRQKQTEQALRQSEEQLRVLVDHVQDYGIIMLDVHGIILSWNAAAEHITGYRADDIVGHHIAALYPPDDIAHGRPQEQLRIASLEGRFEHEELRVRRDDSTFCAHVVINAIHDDNGQLRGFAHISRDVTARLEAERVDAERREEHRKRAAAESSQQRLEAVLQQMPGGVIIAEAPSGRVVLANARSEHILQSSDGRIDGIEAYGIWHGLHGDGRRYDVAEWPLARAVRLGETTVAEVVEFVRPDGSHTWLSISAGPIHDEHGEVVAAVATFDDITERKRAEDALRFLAGASAVLSSSLDYETTLQSVARLAVPLYADWCTVDILEADETMSRVAIAHRDQARLEGALARKRDRSLPRDSHAGSAIARALRTGRSALYPDTSPTTIQPSELDAEDYELIQQFGLRSVLLVPMIVRDRSIGVLSFLFAESGRRYTDADLVLAEELARRCATAVDNAQLYQQARAAVYARDEFLASAAHDLKTPLSSIKGNAQLLKRHLTRSEELDPDRLRRGLGQIESTVALMAELLSDLLDVTRLQLGQQVELDRQPTDLVMLIGQIAVEQQQTAPRHDIRVESHENQIIGQWDAPRIARVLGNLMGNAIKYSPAGGIVAINVRRETSNNASSAVVTIADRGMGIPAADLPYIFDRYRRGSNVVGKVSGSGIGLASTQQIVDQHGGAITVESTEGTGSTFTLTLPLPLNHEPLPATARTAS